MSDPKIIWNEANLKHMTQSWDGPTGKYIATRAERVAAFARATAGVRSGALKSSIGTFYGHRGNELEARVGANVQAGDGRRGYSYWHHEGTLPHVIKAKKAKSLHFFMAGEEMFRKSVHHPGFRGNPYLTNHLKEVFD